MQAQNTAQASLNAITTDVRFDLCAFSGPGQTITIGQIAIVTVQRPTKPVAG
jgi:hypothetical protein